VKLRKSFLTFLTDNSILLAVAVATAAVLIVVPLWKWPGYRNLRGLTNLLPTTHAAEVNSWTLAIEKVKEDRGEPVGKQAKVETPAQLKHYSDTRRFLATQVAEVKQHLVETPQDFVDLAGMISRGELVQLQPVSENYILFGVGGSADNQPFTRYEDRKSINLYNQAGLQAEYDRLAESQTKLTNELAGLKKQLQGRSPTVREGSRIKQRRGSSPTVREGVRQLQSQIVAAEIALKQSSEDKALLDHYYGNAETRQQLFAEYETLEKVGRTLTGNGFDITDGAARRQMKVRMLSSLRPEALKVLDEIAASYRKKFDRPLPVTSLVRPDEYQLELSKTNANATRIETPPHSTGLAFDILYRYMTAAEQSHVMSELARLKDEGRIEVLRENRDHYHVFAFVDGVRPTEQYIAASLGAARPVKVAPAAPAKLKESHHAEKKTPAAKREARKSKRKARR